MSENIQNNVYQGKDELVFMQPFGETEPRWVNVYELIPQGIPIVSEEKREERYDICKSCDQYEKPMCKSCGCFMPQKTWTIDARCPLGKWE